MSLRIRPTWCLGMFLVCALTWDIALPAEPTHATAAESPQSRPANGILIVAGTRCQVLKSCPDAQYNFRLTLLPSEGEAAVSSFDLLFALKDAENGYRLRCRPAVATAGMRATTDGGNVQPELRSLMVELEEIRMGVPAFVQRGLYQPLARPDIQVEVRRRRSALSILFNGQPLLESLNSRFAAGDVAIGLDVAPLAVRDWVYQKYEDIRRVDSFMRAPGEPSDWSNLRGDWKLWTVREAETAHPSRGHRDPEEERSANFFAYTGATSGKAGEWGLAVTGYPFWDRYTVSASVRSAGGAVGVAFFVQDADNFYVARWWLTSRREVPQPLELVQVRQGQEAVIARVAVLGAAGQWYRLSVAAMGAHISVAVDEATVLEAAATEWFAGRAGLYVVGKDPATFDDFEVVSEHAHFFDHRHLIVQCGQAEGGRWQVQEAERGPVRESRLLQLDPSLACYWLGDPSWRSFMLTTEVMPQQPGGYVGLAVERTGPQGDRALLVFRVGEAMQMLLRTGSNETILAEAIDGIATEKPAARHRLALDLTTEGEVAAFVDERLVLRVPDPRPGPGRAGLYTLNAPGAAFERIRVLVQRPGDVAKSVKKPLFAADRYMAGWASGAMAWLRSGDADIYWHKSDFFGRLTLSLPPRAGVVAYLCAQDDTPETGYEVTLVGTSAADVGEHARTIILKRQGRELARALLPEIPTSQPAAATTVPAARAKEYLHITRDGNYLWATCRERELFSFRDPHPLNGTRIAIKPAGVDLNLVEVEQYQVLDYLFETAPVDWRRIGTWEVTNRFTCDPRWSWFGATEWQGLAAIWNKYEFVGDFTLEFYAGMRMARDQGMSYPRTGEINATVCGDGRNLSSGYSIITGAWDPWWSGTFSYILRGETKVAASDRELVPRVRERNPVARAIPVAWDPGGRPVHGAWYYLKVRRQGDRIRFYFDDVPIMDYRDPVPLPGRRIALWTQDNSIMVARARIAYQHKQAVPLPVQPLPATTSLGSCLVHDPPPGGPSPRVPPITSSTHPGVFCDFEDDFCGWRSDDPDQGAYLDLCREKPGSGQASLRLTNLHCGGTFGAVLDIPPFDAQRIAELRFKYRFEPEVRANLYFTLGGTEYFLRLSGAADSTPTLRCLGAVPDFRADGQWHEAKVDLAALILDALARQRLHGAGGSETGAWRCTRIRLGNYHQGYLRAGFGGNPEGATAWLDDFSLVPLGGPSAEFAWASQPQEEYRYSVTPDHPDEGTTEVRGQSASWKAPGDGLWFFNLTRKMPDATATRHLPLRVETKPVQIAAVHPAAGALWGGEPLRVRFDRLHAAALELDRTLLTAGDRAVPYDPAIFQFDWRAKELRLDLSQVKSLGPYQAGERVAFSLRVGKSALASAEPVESEQVLVSWSCTYNTSADRTPPSAVTLMGYPLRLDFEGSLGGLPTDRSPATLVERDPSSAATGNYSLRAAARRLGSPLAVSLVPQAFHAGLAPILAFDYRMNPHVRVDLLVAAGGRTQQIRLSDVDHEGALVGVVPAVVLDDRWRHAEVNLRRTLARGPLIPNMLHVASVVLRDTGYVANPPDMEYRLDNITLVPVVSAAKGIELAWTAHDASGVQAYSYCWTAQPAGEAPPRATTTATRATFREVPEGDAYFHIRAQDRAGNWGPTSTWRFLVDNRPPRLTLPTPANLLLSETLTLNLTDDGEAGVRYDEITLGVDDQVIPSSALLATIDLDRETLTWEWPLNLPPTEGPRPNGTVVTFRAANVSDFAGNVSPPQEWRARTDYTADRVPPTTVEISSLTGELRRMKTFTRGLEDCAPESEGSTTITRVPRPNDDATDAPPVLRDYALQVEAILGQRFGVLIERVPYSLADYPCLAFDYRLPPGGNLHLAAEVDGRHFSIALTGHRPDYIAAGKIDGGRADGRWHHAIVNLRDLLKESLPPNSPLRVTWLGIGNMSRGAEKGTRFWLDNIAIYGPVIKPPQLTFSAWDATGIAGYSFLLDAKPDTVPNENITTTARTVSLNGLPVGSAYLHVRARDGAGNWGTTVHVPLLVQAPLPTATAADNTVLCPNCGQQATPGRTSVPGQPVLCPRCGAVLQGASR